MLGSESTMTGMPVWCDAEDFCTLADGERHLGHIVYTGEWEAYDGTRPNDTGDGFRELGAFQTVALAKMAVEQAVCRPAGVRARSAGSGMWVS